MQIFNLCGLCVKFTRIKSIYHVTLVSTFCSIDVCAVLILKRPHVAKAKKMSNTNKVLIFSIQKELLIGQKDVYKFTKTSIGAL